MTSFFTFLKIVVFIPLFHLTNLMDNAKIMCVDLHGEVSERFKELVLKTSDSKEPRVRIPFSPPFFKITTLWFSSYVTIRSSTQVGDEAPLLRA